jgi:hypothetical protein
MNGRRLWGKGNTEPHKVAQIVYASSDNDSDKLPKPSGLGCPVRQLDATSLPACV